MFDGLDSDVASNESTCDQDSCEQDNFDGKKVHHLLAVERPSDKAQIYVASGLRLKYHFSCPTSFLPSLFHLVQQKNNSNLDLIFIPCTTSVSEPTMGLSVINGISVSDSMQNDEYCHEFLHDIVLEVGRKGSNSSSVSTTKRSYYSTSIGLQTMYSHQQHLARYLMLPHHSKPHVLSGKDLPKELIKSIVSVYQKTNNLIRKTGMRHPFITDDTVEHAVINSHRYRL
jgi:hypothetical protein